MQPGAEPGQGTSSNRRASLTALTIAVPLLGTLVFLARVYVAQRQTVDDGFIFFRFARNLAAGEGLVWNLGWERAEGYTSHLQTLLLAGLMKLGMEGPPAGILLGVTGCLGTAFLLFRGLPRFLGCPAWLAGWLVALYLADESAGLNATSGLETHLFTFTAAALWYAALRYVDERGARPGLALGAAAFFVALARPEGALLAILTFAPLFFLAGTRRRVLRTAVPTLAVALAYLGWKYAYFGYLLPNSFHVKVESAVDASFNQFTRYLIEVCAPIAAAFALLLPWLSRTDWGVRTSAHKGHSKWILTLLPLAGLLGFYITSVDASSGAHRYYWPSLPLIVASLGCLAGALRQTIPAAVPAVGSLLVAAWCLVGPDGPRWPLTVDPPEPLVANLEKLGAALATTGLANDATLVCDSAGIVGYASEFDLIDRSGLMDNFLSGREDVSFREREDYIFGLEPDVYIGWEPPATPGAAEARQDPAAASSYVRRDLLRSRDRGGELVSRIFALEPEGLYRRMVELRDHWHWLGQVEPRAYWEPFWGVKMFAYVRRDSPHFDVLVEALQAVIELPPERVNLAQRMTRVDLPAALRGER